VAEDAATFERLAAPVKRVCALQVPIPYSPVLENHVFPDRNRIIVGIREVLDAKGPARAVESGDRSMSLAPIVIADSITRVGPEATGAVVVNASHGGVYAAYLAAKLHAAAVIFNDAGIGRDRAGIGGLDYLQELGIATAAVGHETARIGDGADMMASGVITHSNSLARSLGVSTGQSCHDAATRLQQARPSAKPAPEALEAVFLLEIEPPQVWALDSASLVLPEHKDAIVITG